MMLCAWPSVFPRGEASLWIWNNYSWLEYAIIIYKDMEREEREAEEKALQEAERRSVEDMEENSLPTRHKRHENWLKKQTILHNVHIQPASKAITSLQSHSKQCVGHYNSMAKKKRKGKKHTT